MIDAGIATDDNLALLKQKGYNYLCVSRTKLKKYTLAEDRRSVTVCYSRKRSITLSEVRNGLGSDYFLD